MMPRFSCVLAVLVCAGCAGRHNLAQVQPIAPQVLTAQSDQSEPLQVIPSGDLQLAALQVVGERGERYSDQLIEENDAETVLHPLEESGTPSNDLISSPPTEQRPALEAPSATNVVQLNLPTALSMIGGQHPAVGFAQWRVQEAYAQLEQARVLWLPSIQAGMSYHRHDGNYQASDGSIVDVNRGSLQYGLGTGATGAGTTPRPGIVAQFHLADAIFEPKIARKRAWSESHAVGAALNRQLMEAAVAYIELLNAHQEKTVLNEAYRRTSELAKLTRDYAEAGQGLQADADRLQTELMLVESRVVASNERIDVASAQMAQTLNTDPMSHFVPLDPSIVPIDVVGVVLDRTSLITTGLTNRPELKQAGALVAAACDAYQQQKYTPLIPSVLLGFSNGGFAGGLGDSIDNERSRYDFDAIVSWEVRNLGFGERASRSASNARIQQAKFQKIRLMDQVAREVGQAHTQVLHRRQQVEITRSAIQSAEDSYERNLGRIRDGQGLPLEVLQSIQALEAAQLAYLNSVVNYNNAQFRLQWALGWPISARAAN